jgi:uncharacterized FlaG/YvyC family protein
MTKLKTYDLIRLRQIDREKSEKVIKEYAEFFGKLTGEERERIFKKDPNAELICEFISKLFKLSIKITEGDILRRWFDYAKSQNFFEDIECAQGIGNDKMIDCLLHLPFEKKIKIINEAEYYGDLDIAEKLLDIEGRAKKAESALASFREEINERLNEIDKDVAEKLRELKETTVAIEDRTKNTESALASFREEINGRLDDIDKDIAEKLGVLKETTVAIEDRTKKAESALASFREEINGRLNDIDKDVAEKLRELKETTVAIEDRTKNTESALASFREEINGRLDEIDKDINEKIVGLKKDTSDKLESLSKGLKVIKEGFEFYQEIKKSVKPSEKEKAESPETSKPPRNE